MRLRHIIKELLILLRFFIRKIAGAKLLESDSFSDINDDFSMAELGIAGEGFEPPTSGLWARRALQAALSRYAKSKIQLLLKVSKKKTPLPGIEPGCQKAASSSRVQYHYATEANARSRNRTCEPKGPSAPGMCNTTMRCGL